MVRSGDTFYLDDTVMNEKAGEGGPSWTGRPNRMPPPSSFADVDGPSWLGRDGSSTTTIDWH